MAINPKLRFQILNRDWFECKYCWLKAGNWIQLQVDHIIPKSQWGKNTLENLITSCYECNIWKWKNTVKEIEEDIYKQKIKEKIWEQILVFFDYWNSKWFWTIDNNTKALIKLYYSNIFWWNSYENNLCNPRFIEKYLKKEWGCKVIAEDIEKLNFLFKQWWELCNDVLQEMEFEWLVCLKDNLYEISSTIEDVLDDKVWKKWGNCYSNYNFRLNYKLWEILYRFFIDWFLKNDFPIKKYSYFHNEIIWHKE